MRSIRLAGLVVLLLAGCLPIRAKPGGPRDGEVAASIKGIDANGRPLELSDHLGKVVLLSFWHGG